MSTRQTSNRTDFMNPTPAKKFRELTKELKHGKSAGAHLDDTGDIYDHTKSFFDGNKDF